MLFCIGGDGTLRGAHDLHLEIKKRGLKIGIVGIPKTIDNDILWMVQSFGFATAVSEARNSIQCAHTEAIGAYNGVGIVKLMGRDSGYIAACASMALAHVNFVLVPEVPFELHGEKGLLAALKKRLIERQHAVIVVAEGAGQDLLINAGSAGKDDSGNVLHNDIGLFLKDSIKEYFKAEDISCSIKYIDPSYIIRSVPANAFDSVYCMALAHDAVHAAMAGKTDVVIGRWGTSFTHVPISAATAYRNRIDLESEMWRNVLEATGQAASMVNDK
jgi:6-phosphofructokinase 1